MMKIPEPSTTDDGSASFEARELVRRAQKAALATLMGEPEGWPFASMVIPACTVDGSPLFVLSDLAQHARNLARDSRASLLVEKENHADPQATPRVTLVGRAIPTDEPSAHARFLAYRPETYLGKLADFRLYRFEVHHLHFIGGFARARRLRADAFLLPAAKLQLAERQLIDKLNASPLDLDRITSSRGYGRGWQAAGIDAEGIDLTRGGESKRLLFSQPLMDPTELPDRLVNLSQSSREWDNQ